MDRCKCNRAKPRKGVDLDKLTKTVTQADGLKSKFGLRGIVRLQRGRRILDKYGLSVESDKVKIEGTQRQSGTNTYKIYGF